MTIVPTKLLDARPVTVRKGDRATARAAAPRVGNRVIYAYSLMAFTATMVSASIQYVVPQLYAKELGVSLAGIGAIIFISRILQAVADQVMGYLSDRTVTRWGARKPWIIGGTAAMLAAAFFVLNPPAHAGLVYFGIWKVLFELAFTAKVISYNAWGAELSNDYNERSRITGARGVFSQFGGMANDVIPIALVGLGIVATSAYSLHLMRCLFAIGCVLIPLFTAISLYFAPQGRAVAHERQTVASLIQSVGGNRPFWYYLAGFSILGVGQGAIALIFTFYDGYLKVGAAYPYMMTAFAAALAIAIPGWTWLSRRIGKHRVYALAALLNAGALQVFWFISPATTPHLTVIVVTSLITVINGAATACYVTTPAAILADVIDYGEWRTGAPRAGSYFGLSMLTSQGAAAVGAGLAFMALAQVGYVAKAGAINSAAANFGLMTIIVLVPGVLISLSALMMWRFPLDERRQRILRRRLDSREAALLARQAAADNLIASTYHG
jgi:Na+/melibiose symporter-like transporter